MTFFSCSRKVTENKANNYDRFSDSSFFADTIAKVSTEDYGNTYDYYTDSYTRFDNYTYNNSIKTIQLYKSGFELNLPLIQLNTSEKLTLKFDDLDDLLKDYRFTIVHCASDWTKSDIEPYEYLENQTEEYITDANHSFNTIQQYMNYQVDFPTDDFKITKSGNYILKVYEAGDAENPVFTRRFMVYEPKTYIAANVKRATQIENRNYKQEVDFTINTYSFSIISPYTNLQVVVRQNNRWDNAISNLKPKFINNNELIYDYEFENCFDGGSEFRNFDIKSLKYQSIRIKSIRSDYHSYNVYLLDDEKRTFQRYQSETDINGKALIKTEDAANSDLSSEYAWVNFNLPYQQVISDGSLYVFGALADWNYSNTNMMQYDYTTNSYRCKILLKQGYYNYQYIYLPNNETSGQVDFIEGNHWETENDYIIQVYYKEPGTSYEQLIGMQFANSIHK